MPDHATLLAAVRRAIRIDLRNVPSITASSVADHVLTTMKLEEAPTPDLQRRVARIAANTLSAMYGAAR